MAGHLTLPATVIWILAGSLILLPMVMMMFPVIFPGGLSGPAGLLTGPRSGLLAAMFQGLFWCMGLLMGREPEPAPVPETLIQGRICEEVTAEERTFRTRLDKVYYRSGESWTRLQGKVQVHLELEERCKELLPGTFISASGRMSVYEDPLNPLEFNYGAYQRGKGIFYQLYLDSSSWMPCPDYAARGLKIRSKLLRRTLMKRIEQQIVGGDERAILYALLLGYREDLGEEVRQQFIRSGSMHILAVSGLHVGILYILPAFLIGRIRGSITLRWAASLVLLTLLWFYALLTGLSPSVIRAVTMCSVHRAALLIGRKAGIFHVLSLTAFIMILSRPAILFETGFQLSFAAVAGIAAFQKPLFTMMPLKGWLPRRTWQLASLSLAAQGATVPLSLYYFHQCSHVFILTNLAVIPLATVILYTGLAFMLFSSIGLYPLSGILEWLAGLLGVITGLTGRMPWAFSEHLSLLPLQVVLCYLTGILAYLFLQTRSPLLFRSLAAGIALMLLVSCVREYRVRCHEGFYVFAIPRESAISLVRDKEHIMYRGGRIRSDTLQVPYVLRNFVARHKLSSPVALSFRGQGEEDAMPFHIDTKSLQLLFLQSGDRRIVVLRRWPDHLTGLAVGLETDILVLVDNVSCRFESLIEVFKPGLVIADGSSHPARHAALEKACERCGIPFHSTEKGGFYAY